MSEDRFYLTEDVTDWKVEWGEREDTFPDEDALLAALSYNGPAKVARLAIISREVGASPQDILPKNKVMLNVGGIQTLARLQAKRRRLLEMPNGTKMTVREYIGVVRERTEEDEDELDFEVGDGTFGPVTIDNDLALDRAIEYLFQKVMRNYAWERMKIIAGKGGDLSEVAERLHNEIDSMVSRLVNGGS